MALLKRPDGAAKQKKRTGRGPGSGNGTTAGRGTKGQNARSGGRVRPGFEGGQMPLYRRVARRGFSNYWFKKEYTVLNLVDLERKFAAGEEVNLATLREQGLIGTHEDLVKILGEGALTKKLVVTGVKVSGSARAKIEAAGGSVADEERKLPTAAQETSAAESAPEEGTVEESRSPSSDDETAGNGEDNE